VGFGVLAVKERLESVEEAGLEVMRIRLGVSVVMFRDCKLLDVPGT